jgi:hypothetical protein
VVIKNDLVRKLTTVDSTTRKPTTPMFHFIPFIAVLDMLVYDQ